MMSNDELIDGLERAVDFAGDSGVGSEDEVFGLFSPLKPKICW